MTNDPLPCRCLVERLEASDAAAVWSLEAKCFPAPWTLEQIERGLTQRVLHVFGVRADDGRVLGYLSFYAVAGQAEVVNLAVEPRLRRRGMGRAILDAVLQSWRDMGIHEAFLEVRESNVAARGLYAACGFRPTGVRRDYYPDSREDAVMMIWRFDEQPIEQG